MLRCEQHHDNSSILDWLTLEHGDVKQLSHPFPWIRSAEGTKYREWKQ